MQIGNIELPRTKNIIETTYASILAPFATCVAEDNSREHDETLSKDENRSSFQRDRDRIIHSKAFRRLMYKTQVFVNHEGDHFRTRLTHSLEVSQFARGICKSLALNEDLAEAIALGHDLGHTPFGHAVERYLDSELKTREMGRFYHNEQSVRVVDFIEHRSKDYCGLNLTAEVREGILKHNDDFSGIYEDLNPGKLCSSLEGQIVGLVDTIAYICHDLQDGIASGLVEKSLRANPDFKESITKIINMIGSITELSIDVNNLHDTFFIDNLIHKLIMSITEQSVINLVENNVGDLEDVHKLSKEGIQLITLKKDDAHKFKNLKNLVYESIYGMNTIQIMDSKAIMVAKDLFNAFTENPKLLPPEEFYKYMHIERYNNYKGFVNNEVHVICDYIACMTDRFALEEHERIRNPRIKI
jgi:dGTPase